MVDLPAGAFGNALRTVSRPWRISIDPDSFILARELAGLSRLECGRVLHVTARTVRNWEHGRARIPFAAFKLIRILSHYELPGVWSEFSIRHGVLWSPEGKPFQAWEMSWLSLVFRMARHWLADRGLDQGFPAGGAVERLRAAQGRAARAAAPGNPPGRPVAARNEPGPVDRAGERRSPGPLPSPTWALSPRLLEPCL